MQARRLKLWSRRLRTSGRIISLLLPLPILLSACASGTLTLRPRPVVQVPIRTQDRLALIRSQLRDLCPNPLSSLERDRAAAYVLDHPEAFPIIADLDRLDNASLLCRQGPVTKG